MKLQQVYEPVMGGRIGTASATREQLLAILGEPSFVHELLIDSKVTIQWVYKTPRGLAEIRDYWWNAPTEWSLAAVNGKAALWLARSLRRAGIKASSHAYDLGALPV